MDSKRHLSWSNLEEIIELGVPRRIPVAGSPQVEIMIESGGSLIGLITPLDPGADLPCSPLTEIHIRTTNFNDSKHIYVAASSRRLFREFYSLITNIADRIQLQGTSAGEAIQEEIRSWHELLRHAVLLRSEEEIGLFGELWVLERLLRRSGPSQLDAWTGPLKEPHDFRFGATDFEVKTTRSRARKHIINDLQQLIPAEGKSLYLVSLQLQPAGAGGRRLPDIIDTVSQILSGELTRHALFWETLSSAYGYQEEHSEYYNSRYELRTKPTLIKVDARFPRITRADLARALDPSIIERIDHVHYTIDVSGLGVEMDTQEFHSVLDIS